VHEVHLDGVGVPVEPVLGRRVEMELLKVVTGSGKGHVAGAGRDLRFLGLLRVAGGAAGRVGGVLLDVLEFQVGVSVVDGKGRL
jgi:hypothetical protein